MIIYDSITFSVIIFYNHIINFNYQKLTQLIGFIVHILKPLYTYKYVDTIFCNKFNMIDYSTTPQILSSKPTLL